MPPRKDKTGNRYGRWTVIKFTDPPPGAARTGSWFEVKCDCGTVAKKAGTSLSNAPGSSKSCGCYKLESSRLRHGFEAANWRGGRTRDEDGYILVYLPSHPNAKGNGYVPEHRLVMSEVLGRPLLRTETVHHKNGVRDDNRPENLELWTAAHASGGRVSDMIRYARELEALYGHLFPKDN